MNPQGNRMENRLAGPGLAGTRSSVETAGLADAIGMIAAVARRPWSRVRGRKSAVEHDDVERLRSAFEAFEGAAGKLAASYGLLRDRVQELSAQLAQAHGELARELAEKQALAERQAALLKALPAG